MGRELLAYYLAKKREQDFRSKGESQQVETLLRLWNQLVLVHVHIEIGEDRRQEWQWSLGEVGRGIQEEIQRLGWRLEVDAQAVVCA